MNSHGATSAISCAGKRAFHNFEHRHQHVSAQRTHCTDADHPGRRSFTKANRSGRLISRARCERKSGTRVGHSARLVYPFLPRFITESCRYSATVSVADHGGELALSAGSNRLVSRQAASLAFVRAMAQMRAKDCFRAANGRCGSRMRQINKSENVPLSADACLIVVETSTVRCHLQPWMRER
jgi:hypothetical protein